MSRLESYRSSRNSVALALWPVSLLYGAGALLRRLAWRAGLLPSRRIGAPVIVVDRLVAGNGGQALLLIRLAEVLRTGGYRPGIACRGRTGLAAGRPRRVKEDSDPREAGDEAVLLARRCGCPVVADPDLAVAARALVNDHACTVILCDGGLHDYALASTLDIVVFDERDLGNGFCWPAGPLQQPLSCLRTVDFIIRPDAARSGEYRLTLSAGQAVNLADPYVSCSLAAFRGTLVHAVAAPAEPLPFFDFLKTQGLRLLAHSPADPQELTAAGLDFDDTLPVLLTEKAVIAYRPPAQERFWWVPIEAQLDPELERRLLLQLAASAAQSLNPPLR